MFHKIISNSNNFLDNILSFKPNAPTLRHLAADDTISLAIIDKKRSSLLHKNLSQETAFQNLFQLAKAYYVRKQFSLACKASELAVKRGKTFALDINIAHAFYLMGESCLASIYYNHNLKKFNPALWAYLHATEYYTALERLPEARIAFEKYHYLLHILANKKDFRFLKYFLAAA